MLRNPISIFTDGSSNYKDGSGGWAFVAIDSYDGEEVGSGHASDTTNNRMEQTAWAKGLSYLFETLGPCDVLVYSDSQYVGLGAMDRTRKRKRNRDLWNEIDKAIDQHSSVEFVWVKGHDGSHYNQQADGLAVKARKAGIKNARN